MLTETMSKSKRIFKYILFSDLLIIWKETGFQFIKVLPGAQINIQHGWGKEFCLPPSPPKYFPILVQDLINSFHFNIVLSSRFNQIFD